MTCRTGPGWRSWILAPVRRGWRRCSPRHDLPCIPPTALAAFLGAEAAPRYAHDVQGDEAVWAAACALAPASVDEATALALLQHLRQHCGLVVSPWALRALRAEAPGPAGRLQWLPLQRAALINWLRDMEAESGLEGLAAPSVLHTALSFWETAAPAGAGAA